MTTPASGWGAGVRGLAAFLRIEDVVVIVVAAIGAPLAGRLLGGQGPDPSGTPSPAAGIAGLVAILGVLACLATRGPDEPSPVAEGQLTLQGWARFPLAAGVGIVGLQTLPGLGLDADPFVAATFLVVFLTAMLHARLPVLPVDARRALVLPMALLAATTFDRIMGDGLDDLIGGMVRGTTPPEVVAFWPLIVAAAATVYVMLIVAPRSIADPGASGLAWAVRFVVLLASVAVAALVGL